MIAMDRVYRVQCHAYSNLPMLIFDVVIVSAGLYENGGESVFKQHPCDRNGAASHV